MVRILTKSKKKLAERVFEDDLELILPGDKVVIKDADDLDVDVRGKLGVFGDGVEGRVIQFYSENGHLYCHVKTKHEQQDFNVPYRNLDIVKRPKGNKGYASKLKRAWEQRHEVSDKLHRRYSKE